ncbi:MAG TPA: glutamate--tRNA ligase, partial [Sphingomicrobium sp.]|nr:glutamate--tRNA ligase [Sphingomicrobium sp.]
RDRLPEAIGEAEWQLLRPNLARVIEAEQWLPILDGDIDPPPLSHDDRALVREAATIAERLDWADSPWNALSDTLKKTTGRKGRALFMPLRLALTGRESGPEMAALLDRIGKERSVGRLAAAARR